MNGTRLNDRVLEPSVPYRLQDGDHGGACAVHVQAGLICPEMLFHPPDNHRADVVR